MSIHCSRPGICARSSTSCFSFRSNCKDVRTSTLKDSISLWSYQRPSLSLSSLSTDDSRQDIGEEKSNFSSNLTHLWKDDIAAVLNRSLMSSSEGMMDSILALIVFSIFKEDGGKTNRWKLQYPQTKKDLSVQLVVDPSQFNSRDFALPILCSSCRHNSSMECLKVCWSRCGHVWDPITKEFPLGQPEFCHSIN